MPTRDASQDRPPAAAPASEDRSVSESWGAPTVDSEEPIVGAARTPEHGGPEGPGEADGQGGPDEADGAGGGHQTCSDAATSGQRPTSPPERDDTPPPTPRRAVERSDTQPLLPGDLSAIVGSATRATKRGEPASQRLPVIARDGYRIGPVFAQGGIGRIVDARDRYLNRRVALKELLVRSPHAEERFVREALVTARLQHPGVVPVYAAGRWPSGEPFYAMKMVSGRPLAEALSEASTYDDRLSLLPHVLAVAETMAYAHSRRIIHRDLKPENILLGSYGETVVIDWGLAKELDREDGTLSPLADSALRAHLRPSTPQSGQRLPGKDLTMVGAVVGTPAYMPPEQAYGDPVDQRADVYALGAILYHVVAGEPPFDGETAVAIILQVTSDPPPPVEEREPAVPPELAAIIATAMAYEPSKRYPSAAEFADDLRRFQTGQLVAAHHYSARERLRRVLRRYRGPLAVAGASLVLLAILSVISIARIIAERDEARVARGQAENARDTAATAREESEAARLSAERQADALALEQARIAAHDQPGRTIELLSALHDQEDWSRLRMIAADAAAQGLGRNLVGHTAGASRLAFSPDGRLLVSAADDCTATVWDLEAGRSHRLLGHTDEVWRVAFNADGTRLASASRDHTIGLWEPSSGRRVAVLAGHEAAARTVAFTADGEHLLSGGDDDRLLLWSLADHSYELLEECLAGSMFTDGTLVGCLSSDRMQVVLIDLDDRGRKRWDPGIKLSPAGDFAPDADELAVGTFRGDVLRWRWSEPPRDPQRLRLEGGDQLIRAVRYTADGARIVAAGANREVWAWDRASGERVHTLLGHNGRISRLDVSPDSRRVASIGGEAGPRLWSLDDGKGSLLTGLRGVASAVRFSPDGGTLAAASTLGEVRLWRSESADQRQEARIPDQRILAVDPHQPRLATVDAGGILRIWDLESQRVTFAATRPRELTHLAFLPNSDTLVMISPTAELTLMSTRGELLRSFPGETYEAPGAPEEAMAAPVGANAHTILDIANNGRHVLATRRDGALLHWDLERQEALIYRGHSGDILGRAFSPDSRWAVTAGHDRTVRLWDLESGSGELIDTHPLPVSAVVFSPDARYVYSGGESHELRIYDRITRTTTSHPIGGYKIYTIAPFADGQRLALIRGDGQILIWDLAHRRVRQRLLGHQVAVRRIVLADEDETLISQSEDGEIRIWDLSSGESRVLAIMDDWAIALEWHPSRRAIALSKSDEVGIWSDPVPRTRAGFLRWLADTRSSLTLQSDDLTPPKDCRVLEVP